MALLSSLKVKSWVVESKGLGRIMLLEPSFAKTRLLLGSKGSHCETSRGLIRVFKSDWYCCWVWNRIGQVLRGVIVIKILQWSLSFYKNPKGDLFSVRLLACLRCVTLGSQFHACSGHKTKGLHRSIAQTVEIN
ncbi:non-structural protein 3 [Striga asiatica]|uniref:Non-structural protein 3 n=1 Tax=Striga asiatica TaxID=4170 RepID=A0A5A7QWR3_STRAF|nr:non-structural protein 3 [Striga asiatica]